MRVLLVNNCAHLDVFVRRALKLDDHHVVLTSLERLAHDIESDDFELFVLALESIGAPSLKACEQIRAARPSALILALAERAELPQRLAMFKAGADEFLSMSLVTEELQARIRALGRRRAVDGTTMLRSAGAEVDLAARRVTRGESSVSLTPREWNVLECLWVARGHVVPRTALLAQVWGEATSSSGESLEVLVGRIRKKIGPDWIRTLRGGGYSLGVLGAEKGTRMRVLVVDDSADLRDLVQRALTREEHEVEVVDSVAGADAALARGSFDLVILDLGLPDGWGATWCQRVRHEGLGALVLVLTAHADVVQRLEVFNAGADDFLAKPFSVAELRARIRALGRRRGVASATVLRHEGAEVNLVARRASRDGAEAPLTAREWSVLECLWSARGQMVPRTSLLAQVWGDSSKAASLEVLVGRIRKKLGPDWIQTVRGEGYAFGL